MAGFLAEDSYRVFGEIFEAVERAFSVRKLNDIVSDDGSTAILPGLKGYIAMVITSYTGGPMVHELFQNGQAALAEHVPRHMSRLVRRLHEGDGVLMRGLVKRGSVDDLASQAMAYYGDAAAILGSLGQDNRTLGYLSRRSVPVIEGMAVIGAELDLLPRQEQRLVPVEARKHFSSSYMN